MASQGENSDAAEFEIEALRNQYKDAEIAYFLAIEQGSEAKEILQLKNDWETVKRIYKLARTNANEVDQKENINACETPSLLSTPITPDTSARKKDKLLADSKIEDFSAQTVGSEGQSKSKRNDRHSAIATQFTISTNLMQKIHQLKDVRLHNPCRCSIKICNKRNSCSMPQNFWKQLTLQGEKIQMRYSPLEFASSSYCQIRDNLKKRKSAVIHLADDVHPNIYDSILKIRKGKLHRNVLPITNVYEKGDSRGLRIKAVISPILNEACDIFEWLQEINMSHETLSQLDENIDSLNSIYKAVHQNDQLLQQHISREADGSKFLPFRNKQDIIKHFALDEESWVAWQKGEMLNGTGDPLADGQDFPLHGFSNRVNMLTFIQHMTKPISRGRLQIETDQEDTVRTIEDTRLGENLVQKDSERDVPRSPIHELANIKYFSNLDEKDYEERTFVNQWLAQDLTKMELDSIRTALKVEESTDESQQYATSEEKKRSIPKKVDGSPSAESQHVLEPVGNNETG